MKVFAFKYNPMIEESAFATISLHETKKGAKLAMEFHKNEQLKEWKESDDFQRKRFGDKYETLKTSPFGYWERWIIDEIKILK